MVFVFDKEVFLEMEEAWRLANSEDPIIALKAMIKYIFDTLNMLIIEKEEENV